MVNSGELHSDTSVASDADVYVFMGEYLVAKESVFFFLLHPFFRSLFPGVVATACHAGNQTEYGDIVRIQCYELVFCSG